MIQLCSDRPCSSLMIVGRAVVTMVTSTDVMKVAMNTAAMTMPRLGCGRAPSSPTSVGDDE